MQLQKTFEWKEPIWFNVCSQKWTLSKNCFLIFFQVAFIFHLSLDWLCDGCPPQNYLGLCCPNSGHLMLTKYKQSTLIINHLAIWLDGGVSDGNTFQIWEGVTVIPLLQCCLLFRSCFHILIFRIWERVMTTISLEILFKMCFRTERKLRVQS